MNLVGPMFPCIQIEAFFSDAGSDVTPGTVSIDWLKQRINSDESENIRVLDVTWYSAKDAYPEYLK